MVLLLNPVGTLSFDVSVDISMTLALSLHMQTVELPLDIWSAIRDELTFSEWAMACGTCRATRALCRPLVAAEVCGGRDLTEQLQLERWTGCHSLFLNLQHLRHLHGIVMVTAIAAKIEQLCLNGCLSSLRCLHIISRRQVPLTKTSAEGVFMGLLAKHASVLTLDVKTVSMPLDLPKLQHLILDLDVASEYHWERTHEALFPAFSTLAGLKTLSVQSSSTMISGKTDLTACVHLQCVALQGVELKGGVALPAGCSLHVLHKTQHGDQIMSGRHCLPSAAWLPGSP